MDEKIIEKPKMYIKRIELGDEGFNSWYLIVSDWEHEIECFAGEPLSLKNGQFELVCYISDNIIKSTENNFLILHKGRDHRGCKQGDYIRAKVINSEIGLMKVYGFEFILDELFPFEFKNGDFVEFDCLRMDCLPVD
jgi:hypothetical protein